MQSRRQFLGAMSLPAAAAAAGALTTLKVDRALAVWATGYEALASVQQLDLHLAAHLVRTVFHEEASEQYETASKAYLSLLAALDHPRGVDVVDLVLPHLTTLRLVALLVLAACPASPTSPCALLSPSTSSSDAA